MPQTAEMGQAPLIGRPVSTCKSFRIQMLAGGFARALPVARGVRGLLILVVGVPVALDGRQERRLVVWRPTGRWLAVDELGLTADARRAQPSRQALQAHGDNFAVAVLVLDRGVLGDVDRPHVPRSAKCAVRTACQSSAAAPARALRIGGAGATIWPWDTGRSRTVSPTRRAHTSSSTPTTPWIGTRGARKPSRA